MNYNNYLQTSHWQETRKYKLLSRSACQICKNAKSLHIHHKHYEDKYGKSVLFKERMETLITLCSSCHSLWHKHIKELEKPNKKICRIRRLLELGIIKKRAFEIVGTKGMWEALHNVLPKFRKVGDDL